MIRFFAFCVFITLAHSAILNPPSTFVKIDNDLMKKSNNKDVKLQPRIIGGEQVQTGLFPWHVSLVIRYRNDKPNAAPTFCSGAILNEEWILTTADCIFGANGIRVDVGSVNINTPFKSVYPNSFTIHPQFQKDKFKNNIALLHLTGNNKLNFAKDVTQGKYAPIRLPRKSQADETFESREGYISGFGYSSPNSNNVSQNLLYAEQTVIPNTACIGFYGNDKEIISPQVICSQSINQRQGACTGDGGAPLVINEYGTYTLLGLLSFVNEEGSCGRLPAPAAFIRITKYFDWISNIANYQLRP